MRCANNTKIIIIYPNWLVKQASYQAIMGCVPSSPPPYTSTKAASAVEKVAEVRTISRSLTTEEKLSRLRGLKLFILDNSVRESTVAQIRGHTSADKFQILDLIKSCQGIHHQIIATFGTFPRVDDHFCKQLLARGKEDYKEQHFYCFSELRDEVRFSISNLH